MDEHDVPRPDVEPVELTDVKSRRRVAAVGEQHSYLRTPAAANDLGDERLAPRATGMSGQLDDWPRC
jgi:hypothetical protein